MERDINVLRLNEMYGLLKETNELYLDNLFPFELMILDHHSDNFNLQCGLRALFGLIRDQDTHEAENNILVMSCSHFVDSQTCTRCALTFELTLIRYVLHNIEDTILIRSDMYDYLYEFYKYRTKVGNKISRYVITSVSLFRHLKFKAFMLQALLVFMHNNSVLQEGSDNEENKATYMLRLAKVFDIELC